MDSLPLSPSAPSETPDETIRRLTAELREALDQQAATTEILELINSSPGDLAPVFDAMLEKGMRLCEAASGVLWTMDSDAYCAAALRGVPPEFAEFVAGQRRRPEPDAPLGQLASGASFVHLADVTSRQTTSEIARKLQEFGGVRTLLGVPLRKDGALLGAFHIYRQEVRPFTDKQIALLQNFAAQAVIAIENARLLTETREALEQQTATAEVLQVINSSPGDLAPVFDAMLEKALHLCEADLGGLYRFDGNAVHPLAARSGSKAAAEILQQSFVIEPGSSVERLVRGEDEAVQVCDIVDTEAYRSGAAYRVKFVELTGARTALWVALRKDKTLVGVSSFTARKCVRFPKSRSRCCRTSQRRP
jgi:transcriptional regulator with GAF, ATPase, and Fis domain